MLKTSGGPGSESDAELDQALAEKDAWPIDGKLDTNPVVIRGGLTNRNYLLKINNTPYRLRLNSPVAESLGVDRKREEKIVQRISEAGLGPALLFSGESYRYSLFEYVEGRTWSAKDFQNKKQRARIDEYIRAFQRLSIDEPPRNYRAYLDNYWQQLCDTNYLAADERHRYLAFDRLLEQHQNQSSDYVLCHHDLIPENIIESECGLSIIDWEYAALGHPDLDAYCADNYSNNPNNQAREQDSTVGELVFWLNRLWTLVSDQLRQSNQSIT